MVSIVQWPDDPEDTAALSHIMQDGYEDNYRFGTYDPVSGGYIEYGQGLMLEPGRAYWALAREGLDIEIEGVPVSLDHDVSIELAYNADTGNGWNMIASPNKAAYYWADVELVVYDADGAVVFGPTAIGSLSAGNPYISLKLWRWHNGAYFADTEKLEAYSGYWVKLTAANFTDGERVCLCFPANAQYRAQIHQETRLASLVQSAGHWLKRHIRVNRTAAADDGDTPPMPMGDFSRSTDAIMPESCFVDTAAGTGK